MFFTKLRSWNHRVGPMPNQDQFTERTTEQFKKRTEKT